MFHFPGDFVFVLLNLEFSDKKKTLFKMKFIQVTYFLYLLFIIESWSLFIFSNLKPWLKSVSQKTSLITNFLIQLIRIL